MKIKTTVVYHYLNQSKTRITAMQGGTRSSKTYNILIWLVTKALESPRLISICRQTMPSIKKTVLRDFKEIMKKYFLMWNPNSWKETDKTYTYPNGSVVEFFNLDDDQKVRGAKRQILFINEANETKASIWKQLIFRTTEKVIIDYNPSDEFHWIYDEVLTRDDCDFYKTTFLDNPFLPAELIKEIKRLKNADPNYWKIYGLGERGVSGTTIYKNWELSNKEAPEGMVYYGLDFGFNHPTSLIKIVIADEGVYCKELIYKSGLTTPELIKLMKDLGINEEETIYADSSRPETIEEIYLAGFNIHPTPKGPGSVKAGIDHVNRQKLFVDKASTNLIKELKSYKWKVDKNERVLDDPVKINDDAVDALRYAFCGLMEVQEEFHVGDSLDVAF